MNPDLQAQTDRILEAAAQIHADLHALYWLGVTGCGLLFPDFARFVNHPAAMTPRASQALVNAQVEINRAVFKLNRPDRDNEEIKQEVFSGQSHVRERRILKLIESAKLDLTEAACLTEEEIDAAPPRRSKPKRSERAAQQWKDRPDRTQRREHADRSLRKEWRQP